MGARGYQMHGYPWLCLVMGDYMSGYTWVVINGYG